MSMENLCANMPPNPSDGEGWPLDHNDQYHNHYGTFIMIMTLLAPFSTIDGIVCYIM